MPGFAEFAEAIDSRIGSAASLRDADARKLAEAMRGRDGVLLAFERVAETIHDAIIRPRCAALASRFEHASVEHLASPGGLYSLCVFRPTDRFPATAVVCLGVTLEEEWGRGAMSFSAELTPGLVDYERGDVVAVPLEHPPWNELAAWVETKLLRFVESYLLVERDPSYQRGNVRIDPVCHMAVPTAIAVESLIHDGRAYYFCAPSCRERFAANPELYLRGLVKLNPQAGDGALERAIACGVALPQLPHDP